MTKENENIDTARNRLVKEFCDCYGLKPEQISFAAISANPIFDYGALLTLRWKLLEHQITSTRSYIFENNPDGGSITASYEIKRGEIVATETATAYIGETYPGTGEAIETLTEAEQLAIARAFRRALRAAGFDILKHHSAFLNGTNIESKPLALNEIFRKKQKEIHALANELGLIEKGNREAYEVHLGEMFEGRTSTNDLDNVELSKLIANLRHIKSIGLTMSEKKAA